MVLNIFTDGASRGNPGNSGIGVVIYKDKEMKEKICDFTGKKTNNEAEYLAVIRGIERLREIGDTKANFFSDSEFLVKQLNGQYKVKSEKIKVLYDKVLELKDGLEINFVWIPRTDNTVADSLANKGIDEIGKSENGNSLGLKLNKAFFGKINCLKVQMNNENDVYFHMGILEQKEWKWLKVKMSDMEMGEIINLLYKKEGKCSFFHSFNDKKTQIWCNKSEKGFSIKIGDISKNLSIGEGEVFRVILEETIRLKFFS